MIHFISFADKKYKKTLNRIESEALNSGFFDTIQIFDEDFLSSDQKIYCQQNPRGFGFWSWKSTVVLKNLDIIDYGDILVYSDAGNTINANGKKKFDEYINYLNQKDIDSIFFQMAHLEKTWTKMDLIDYLDAYELLETGQLTACSFLIKKTERTVNLIKKWNNICLNNKNFIDDSVSKKGNDNTFMDHRHDQSVLSILVKKMDINLFEDDTYKYISHHDNTYPINCTRIRY